MAVRSKRPVGTEDLVGCSGESLACSRQARERETMGVSLGEAMRSLNLR
jgi:hypothetical protein